MYHAYALDCFGSWAHRSYDSYCGYDPCCGYDHYSKARFFWSGVVPLPDLVVVVAAGVGNFVLVLVVAAVVLVIAETVAEDVEAAQ